MEVNQTIDGVELYLKEEGGKGLMPINKMIYSRGKWGQKRLYFHFK